MRFRFVKYLALTLFLGGVFPANSFAQNVTKSDYVVVFPQKLLQESLMGSEIQMRLQAERNVLLEQNEASTLALEQEEAELAAVRDQMSPDEFRLRATAFDKKTEFYRERSVIEDRNLTRIVNTWYQRFFDISARMVNLWSSQNEALLVMRGENVFWADPSLDISSVIVQMLDTEYRLNKNDIDDFIFADVEGLEEVSDNYTSGTIPNEANDQVIEQGDNGNDN